MKKARIALFLLMIVSVCAFMISCIGGEHVHYYKYTVTTEATCEAEGVKYGLCSCGDKIYETMPALGHQYSSATCVKGKECLVCGKVESPALGHTEKTLSAIEPTCTKTGLTEGSMCSICNEILVAQEVIPALGHNLTAYDGKEATCTQSGWQAYEVCSRCDYNSYKEIAALGHSGGKATCESKAVCEACGVSYGSFANHAIVVDAAIEPDCVNTGLTEGKHCHVCSTVLVVQSVVPARGHTVVVDKAVAPTCTGTGLTEGSHCSVCNTIFTAQQVIPATGHTVVVDEAVEATCTQTGLTEGSRCSACNTVFTTQKLTNALGHVEEVLAKVDATCTESGLTAGKKCSRCEITLLSQNVIPALGHKEVLVEGFPATCTQTGLTAGKHCSTCGKVLLAQGVIPATGHTVVVDEAVETTCTETGLTEGSHCSACGDVLTAQGIIPATGHQSAILNAVEPDCVNTGLTEGSKCSSCGEILIGQKVVPALGHIVREAVSENEIEPNCVNNGGYDSVVYCDVCLEEVSRVPVIVKALGHVYGENNICTRCNQYALQYTREGDKIYFGSYPQTKVTNSSLISKLNARTGAMPTSSNHGKWTSYGYYIGGSVQNYMWYMDLTEGEDRYRGIYFNAYRPSSAYWPGAEDSYSYQDDNGYYANTIYWFKYEPVEWEIIMEEDGTALIICEMVIDSQEYYHSYNEKTINGKTVYPNNYAESNIRAWLNDNFYNTAFTDLQKQIILTTEVDNSKTSTNNSVIICENTNDNLFLLSYRELSFTAYNITRTKSPTDYAKAQGCRTSSNGYADWWSRSPSSYYYLYSSDFNSRAITYVTADGIIQREDNYPTNTHWGVVPALRICLEHKEVKDNGVEPTCTENGLTEGKHCSTCGEILVAQEIIPAHNYKNSNQCSVCEYISTECFTFTLLSDDTYSVEAKDVNNIPANVIIPSSYEGKAITAIGYEGFCGCNNLTSVLIPESITSIGRFVFYRCPSLVNIKVSKNNTAYTSIDGNLYNKNESIFIQYAVGKTASSFIIPNSVSEIAEGAFANGDNLTSVVMPDSLAVIGRGAFYNCYNLISAVIPNSVTSIGEIAFWNCNHLTSPMKLNLLTSIEYQTFAGCSSLTSIVLGDSVSVIGEQAFHNCWSVISIVIPESVTSIGEEAFFGCYKLFEVINRSSHITVKKGDETNGLLGYYALAVFNVDDEYQTVFSNENGYITYTDGSDIVLVGYVGSETNLILPSNVTKIYKCALYGCSSLTSVTIPRSVLSIGPSAFRRCSSLISIKYCGTEEEWDAISKGFIWDNSTGDYTITYNWDGE